MGRVLLALVLIAVVPSPAAASAGPAGGHPTVDPNPAQPVREDGILGLSALQLPRSGKVCTGASIPMMFRASNVSPGLEVPLPVVEAMVNVTDDQGKTRETLTNGAGLTRFNWSADREGQIRFTVTAQKTFYQAAAPISITVQVEPCQWAMSINYREEFAIIAEVDMVVGAEVSWRGSVGITSTNGDNGTSEVEIRGGSGTYQFYASDKIKAPIHVSIDPPVSGTWNLRGDGSLVNGVLSLDVGTTEESYPEIVYIKLTDTTGHYQVNYKPPAPYINGKGFFIEANKLGHMTFPTTGGAIELSSGLATYFWTDERTAYSLTILLYPVKDMGASLDAPLAFAGAIP